MNMWYECTFLKYKVLGKVLKNVANEMINDWKTKKQSHFECVETIS